MLHKNVVHFSPIVPLPVIHLLLDFLQMRKVALGTLLALHNSQSCLWLGLPASLSFVIYHISKQVLDSAVHTALWIFKHSVWEGGLFIAILKAFW